MNFREILHREELMQLPSVDDVCILWEGLVSIANGPQQLLAALCIFLLYR